LAAGLIAVSTSTTAAVRSPRSTTRSGPSIRQSFHPSPSTRTASAVSPSPRSVSGAGASALCTTDSAAVTRVSSIPSAKSSAMSGSCHSGGR